MQDKPDKETGFNWSNFLIDVFFILVITGCLAPLFLRFTWIYHNALIIIIGLFLDLLVSTAVYYLLKKRDSVYRR